MATVITQTPGCPGSNCPTTYAHTEPGMSYVQGYVVTDPAVLADMNVPEGETVIAVPDSLLADHVQKVQA